MAPRHAPGRRAVAVVGVCAAVVAVPIGMAEAAASPAPESIITVTDCGDGLTITLGGTSVVGIGLPGDDCPSGTATPTPPTCTLPPPPSTPPPSTLPPSTPPPTTSRASTPPPSIASSSPPPIPSPSPRPRTAPQAVPTPPAPTPTPTPTTVRPTPKPAGSTPVLIVPSAQTFHTVPFKRLSTVLIVFVIAIVPVSIARIRHVRRRN